MLAATNRVPVSAGDTVLCPAGTPHAIGAGVLIVELQEPTDLSVLLEWRGFPLGPDDAALGLPMEEALACVTRQRCPPARLDALRGRRPVLRGRASRQPGQRPPDRRVRRPDRDLRRGPAHRRSRRPRRPLPSHHRESLSCARRRLPTATRLYRRIGFFSGNAPHELLEWVGAGITHVNLVPQAQKSR